MEWKTENNKLCFLLFFILFAITLVIFFNLIFTKGVIINSDFQSPLESSDYIKSRGYLWNQFGSYPTFEYSNRLIFTVSSIFFATSESLSKTRILTGFILASLSMYTAIVLFFGTNIPTKSKKILYFGAFIAALFYAFNVWSFHRIVHWELWIGYALLPLFFLFSVKYFQSPQKVKFLLLTVIVWSVSSMTPHFTLFCGLLFFGLFLAFILDAFFRKQNLIKILKPFFLVIFLYLLVNLYWI